MSAASDFRESMLAQRIVAGTAIDLGDDHWFTWIAWAPDRDLNPQYADVPDVDRWGAMIWHRRANGEMCHGAVAFDTPEVRAVIGCEERNVWRVVAWEPLTIEPSVLCSFPLDDGGTCGDHGYVRAGRWVRA